MHEKTCFDVTLRAQSACFTGHRSLPSGEKRDRLIGAVDAVIRSAVSRGYQYFIAGGAVGFDTLAACRVIAAAKFFPEIKLLLALPCRNQTEKWRNVSDIALYKRIMGAAADVVYISDFYTPTCMHERNRFMVDHSSLCIAYCHSDRGGAAYTVEYAGRTGVGVVNLCDPEIKF